MPYSKQTWIDLPDETTPLSAERLNHIEDGIDAATQTAEAVTTADEVTFSPSGSVSSTTVQDAILEVVADFNAELSLVATQASVDAALALKVDKSGDIMTGALTTTQLVVPGNYESDLISIEPGEGGSAIYFIDANGQISLTKNAANELLVNGAPAVDISSKVSKTGDTMTGTLYVDDGAGTNTAVDPAMVTLTDLDGAILIGKNPANKVTAGGEVLATEGYADTVSASKVSLDGDTMTGNLIMDNRYVEAAGISQTTRMSYGGIDVHTNDNTADTAIVPGNLTNYNSADTDRFIRSFITGESHPRFSQVTNGKMSWGSGSAVEDTNLYRSDAGTLKTDGNIIVDGDSITVTGVDSMYAQVSGNRLAIADDATRLAYFDQNGVTLYLPADFLPDNWVVFSSSLYSDFINRFQLYGSGKLAWSNGVDEIDTTLYRSAASTLKTDGTFIVGDVAGSTSTIYEGAAVFEAGGGTATIDPSDSINIRDAAGETVYVFPNGISLEDSDTNLWISKNTSGDLLANGSKVATETYVTSVTSSLSSKNNAIAMAIALG